MNTTRNSSIELLKIVAMFLIVISHSIPRYGTPDGIYCLDLNTAIPEIKGFVINLFHYCGDIGNALFLCSSAYFLSSENFGLQRYLRKAGNIIADTLVISFTAITPSLKCSGKTLSDLSLWNGEEKATLPAPLLSQSSFSFPVFYYQIYIQSQSSRIYPKPATGL